MAEQLVLALRSWTEESRAWELVWEQMPENSRTAAIVQCARLATQTIQGIEQGNGEGDEQRE